MDSIVSVYDFNSIDIDTDTLFLLDDQQNGICLAIKSNKTFTNIELKFKKLKLGNSIFGVILMKSDNIFYSCYSYLNEPTEKKILENLLNLNYINLIVFNNSKFHKIYRISNKIENKLLMCIPITLPPILYDVKQIKNKLKTIYTPEFLWDN